MQRVRRMVDTIRFVVLLCLLPQWLQDALAPTTYLTPDGSYAQRRTALTVGNISIRLNALGEAVFENSLHRFFHGHNGGRFTRADVIAAIVKLSETLGFDVSGCKLTKVAFGLNLTGVDIQATLKALTDYKGKRFLKYEKGKGITGAKRLLTELDIKLYDKQRELKQKRQASLPISTLRYEITSHKLSYLKRLKVSTVADLETSEFFELAERELISRLGACSFTESSDYSVLEGKELEALALVQNLEIFSVYKADRANKDRLPPRLKLAEAAKQKASTTNIKVKLLRRIQEAVVALA